MIVPFGGRLRYEIDHHAKPPSAQPTIGRVGSTASRVAVCPRYIGCFPSCRRNVPGSSPIKTDIAYDAAANIPLALPTESVGKSERRMKLRVEDMLVQTAKCLSRATAEAPGSCEWRARHRGGGRPDIPRPRATLHATANRGRARAPQASPCNRGKACRCLQDARVQHRGNARTQGQ